jgi:hypothetical protein
LGRSSIFSAGKNPQCIAVDTSAVFSRTEKSNINPISTFSLRVGFASLPKKM